MKSVTTYKDITWIDLVGPKDSEIDEAAASFGLDPLVIQDIASPSMRHRVEPNGHYIYLVLHFPILNRQTNLRVNQEIDFIIGKDFIITVHYEPIEAIDNFTKKLEVDSILNHSQAHHPRDTVFFGILKELAGTLSDQLSDIGDWIKDIEAKIFTGKEKRMVFSLSEVSRHLLDFKKSTLPFQDIFSGLKRHGHPLFGDEFITALEGASFEFNKVESSIKELYGLVAELRETNNSLLTTKQNEFIKTLTIMNVVIAFMVGVALVWLGYLAIK
jgi:magnesium transporter